jgi:hypothetical protein
MKWKESLFSFHIKNTILNLFHPFKELNHFNELKLGIQVGKLISISIPSSGKVQVPKMH